MQARVQPKSHEMNMTEGPLLKKLIIYAIPLICTNVLQILFNAADLAVLGIFASDNDVGAVGATGSLIQLIISIFVGLSSGASVLIAKYAGAKDEEGAHRAVGTSIWLALIGGVLLLIIGVTCSRYFLEWMDTPESQIDGATRYMTIYFLGVPIILLYNFLASILRAVGDTFRPLLYLLIGGVLNVGLNIFCVVVLDMTVEGVAIATVASQFVSVVLSFIAICKSKGYGQFRLKYFKIYKKELKSIFLIGIPNGIQGALFNVSNVFIQSSINAFGDKTVTANAAASQLDGIIYHMGSGISLSCMAFVSQNYGAGKVDRMKKVFWLSVFLCSIVAIVGGGTFVLLDDYLLRIFTTDPETIEYAKIRLMILGLSYFLCGIMECFSYSMRAMGKSMTAMIISLIGVCVVRVLWLKTVFLLEPTRHMLYYAWPVSWIITILIYCCFYFSLITKIEKNMVLKIPPKQTEIGHLPQKERNK